MENFSLADIAAATGSRSGGDNSGGWGGGSGAWVLIILFALIFGWGRGFGGYGGGSGSGGNPVTEADLCQSQSFSELKGSVGRLSDSVYAVNTNLGNAICSLGYETLQNSNNTQMQIANSTNALATQLADCCCTTQRGIDSINYNGAMNTAAINANTTAQIQKVLDAICTNRMNDMQNQINGLQLQAAVANVVRYPTGFAYNAGPSPFCASGCGCGCSNI